MDKIKGVLSALSITLGVALVISTYINISSTQAAFRNMTNEETSNADLLAISSTDQKISGTTFGYSDPKIQDVIPYYSTDGLYKNGSNFNSIELIAADFTGESRQNGYQLASGRLPGPGECLITDNFQKQYGFHDGDQIKIRAGSEEQSFTISGIAKASGIAAQDFGRCILTDIHSDDYVGAVTFKIVLKDGTDVKNAKSDLQSALNGRYTVQYPSGKTDEYFQTMNYLFETMMGFGVLAVLLGCFLVYVTVSEYVRKMRQKFSVLKVLGAKRSSLTKLALGKSLIIGLIGTTLGTLLGVGGAFILVQETGRMFNTGVQPCVICPWTAILSIAISAVLLSLLVSVPITLRATRESILSGFSLYNDTRKIKRARIFIAAVLFIVSMVLRIVLSLSVVGRLLTFIAIASGIYTAGLLLFKPFAGFFFRCVERISPSDGLIAKNSLFKNIKGSVNTVMVFSFVIALTLSVFIVVSEISGSISDLSKAIYYGDAAVTSLSGSISTDELHKISGTMGVDNVSEYLIKNITFGGDSDVPVVGYNTDQHNIQYLGDFISANDNEAKKLDEKDTVAISKGLLSDMKLKVGDSLSIPCGDGYHSFKIIRSFSTINDGGKVAVLSKDNFKSCFQDYKLRSVMVFAQKGISFETLSDNLKSSLNDPYLQIDSIPEELSNFNKSNDGFIILIDSMIIIMIMVSILMLVNFMSIHLKNNNYSFSIVRLLGCSNSNITIQNILVGAVYGLFSVFTGGLAGAVLSIIMTTSMNELTDWGLKFSVDAKSIILLICMYLAVAILSSAVAVAMNRKNIYEASMLEE